MSFYSLSRLRTVLSERQSPAEQEHIRKAMLDCVEPGIGYSVFFLIGCAALYGHVPTLFLVLAGCLMICEAVFKIGKVNQYRKQSLEERASPAWRKLIWPGAFYTGVFFGLASLVLLLPLPSPNLIVLSFVFLGVYMTSCWIGSCYMPIAVCKLIPLTLPLVIAFLWVGTPMYMLVSLSLVFMTGMSIFYIRSIVRQHTELIEASERVEELNANLQLEKDAAEQMVINKSRFIASASHDLRQPLHALGLFHSAIRAHVQDDKIKTLMDSVDKSTTALNHLFEGLLDVSRLDAGVIEPEPEHFTIGSLFASMHDEFLELANSRGLQLEIINESCVIFADKILVERILRNLLSNAIEFTEYGSVELSATGKDELVFIKVSDTGPGIPEKEIDRIFDEFHQIGRSTHHDEKGFGLGLAIVRRISLLLDVPLYVSPIDPHGTCFTMELAAGERALIELPEEIGVVEDIRPNTRILVVDDNVNILDGMQTALDNWQVDSLVASSYDEALQSLRETGFVPDLLVCDYHLSDGHNGVETANAICHQLSRDIPCIILTGDTTIESEISEDGIKRGILYKPVHPRKLREAIVSNVRYGKSIGHAETTVTTDDLIKPALG